MPTRVISVQGCAQITKVFGHKLAALVVVATADDDDGGMEAKKNGGIGQF